MYDLDKNALLEILVKPKNALTKQYEKLFELENTKLRFTPDSLKSIAEMAIQRKSGARGLRAILEDVMLEIMYDLPSLSNVEECIINEEVILKRVKPIIVYGKKKESA
jgi:ATP-dependent Clp protease ATP-binding subunit ClpX